MNRKIKPLSSSDCKTKAHNHFPTCNMIKVTDENDASITSASRQNLNLKRERSPTPTKVEAKKLKISSDEALMNGAPEGDLYDITVLQNEALPVLESSVEVTEKLLRESLAAAANDNASWADRFAAVQLIRQVALSQTHRIIINNDCMITIACLESCLNAIGSLRSCSVRNGLLALGALVEYVPALLEKENASLLLNSLLNGKLVASGPRFIIDSAQKLVIAAVYGMSPLVGIAGLGPATLSRSADVSNLASELIATSVQRLTREILGMPSPLVQDDDDDLDLISGEDPAELTSTEEELPSEAQAGQTLVVTELVCTEPDSVSIINEFIDCSDENELSVVIIQNNDDPSSNTNQESSSSSSSSELDNQVLAECFQLLHRGLSAKRPTGRDASRAALQHLQNLLGPSAFARYAQQACTESQVIDIHRELSRLPTAQTPIVVRNEVNQMQNMPGCLGSMSVTGMALLPCTVVTTPMALAPKQCKSATPGYRQRPALAESQGYGSTGRISLRERMSSHQQKLNASEEKSRPSTALTKPGKFTSLKSGSFSVFEDM